MKKIIPIVLIALLAIVSCKNEPKNYATFSGAVENLSSDIDSVTVFISDEVKRQIPINEDGTFSDTIKVEEGKYRFKIGDELGTVYLKNNDDVKIITDYKDFDQKMKFEGDNLSAKLSNVYIQNYQLSSNYLNEKVLNMPKEKFDSALVAYKKGYEDFKNKYSDLDSSVWNELDKQMATNVEGFIQYYAQSKALKEKFTGKVSPDFSMEDINGGIVKLSDFKGKFVYIDIWATWCGPCKREIPFLKELENKYHDKNIVFVSMSVDELKDKDKWKKFVKDEKLQGVQIYAENSWKSDFIQFYEVQGIPRFIMIDTEGKIISPDAPRPSDEAIVKLFNELGA